jgi:hypothetical protein
VQSRQGGTGRQASRAEQVVMQTGRQSMACRTAQAGMQGRAGRQGKPGRVEQAVRAEQEGMQG